MKARTKTMLAVVALVLFLLLYPFSVTLAPVWNVKVLDESGKALAGAYVSEGASQWTLGVHYGTAICSDVRGEAHFPRKTVRANVLTRVSRFVSAFGPHASLGSEAKVGVQRLGYGDLPNDTAIVAWDGSATRVNSRLVLHKCPNGFTGYMCHFDYDYSFRIGGSEAREIAACQSAP
jgi:hypothetical protein